MIFGGIRSIAKVAELVVPLMAGANLLLALWVIGHNIEHTPAILALIFKSAFGPQEAPRPAPSVTVFPRDDPGRAAWPVLQRSRHGLRRPTRRRPLALSAASGFARLCANARVYRYHRHLQHHCGDHPFFRHTRSADRQHQRHRSDAARAVDRRRQLGAPFVAIAIFFFAFTSIIANYAYAESNLVFLEHNHPGGLLIFRCVALVQDVRRWRSCRW